MMLIEKEYFEKLLVKLFKGCFYSLASFFIRIENDSKVPLNVYKLHIEGIRKYLG